MNPEKQRIKIAKACGWKPDPETKLWYALGPDEILAGFKDGVVSPLPDYLNDLNAMHEAEKILAMDFNRPDQWEKYMDELNRICYPDHEEEPEILGRRYIASCRRQHADAKTKAEAFLRTLNLWENDV